MRTPFVGEIACFVSHLGIIGGVAFGKDPIVLGSIEMARQSDPHTGGAPRKRIKETRVCSSEMLQKILG